MSSFTPHAFIEAGAFLSSCAPHLLATRDVSANLAIASAYTLADKPKDTNDKSVWFGVSSSPTINETKELVTLSVAGTWPCVLASSVSPSVIDTTSAMEALVKALDDHNVPTRRVSTVVGPRALADPFVKAWSAARDIQRKEKPLMHFYLTYVTPELLKPAIRESVSGLEVRLGVEADAAAAGPIIHKFTALGSHPLTEEAALASVKNEIAGGGLYVASLDGTLVGVTCAIRSSPGVRAISRVYTQENVRGKGIAEAMVRYTCQR
jgi:hypothetical protein